jgi:hypothetical protein
MKKILLLCLITFSISSVYANEARLKAWEIHNRLTGVPPMPGSVTLGEMENAINANSGIVGLENAAKIAIQSRYFYDVLLKNWIKPMTNREKSKNVPLNDFVTTVIGAIRDSDQVGKPFSRILYGDLVYVGPSMGDQNFNFRRNSNSHFEEIENRRLSLKDVLVERMQSQVNNTENSIADENRNDVVNLMAGDRNGAAGILSSRAAGEAYFSAGTNRRATRYMFMNFLCRDFEDMHDTTTPDFRVRKDVPRDPGGDSRTYKNSCVGCHAGQDALGGAFAHYEWRSGRVQYTSGVQGKLNRDPLFDAGHTTTDDSWINLWNTGQNASLGWKGVQQGNGASELGRMVSKSRAFSVCMAKKVYKLVCIKSPGEDDQQFIDSMAQQLEQNDKYDMKNLFVKTTAKCIEDKHED